MGLLPNEQPFPIYDQSRPRPSRFFSKLRLRSLRKIWSTSFKVRATINSQFNCTSTSYDYRDVEWGTTAHVVAPNARVGIWFFGVYGSIFSCSFRITAVIQGKSSPNNISDSVGPCGDCGHGTCQSNGKCLCQSGYTGDHCDVGMNSFFSPLCTESHSCTKFTFGSSCVWICWP